ncbi:hypothetical protein CCMSSC00406_0009945 [Pleurotus cornucopiae]|uniref:Uncharacterized protein n=1 Tax=Pleurotus cornucopiae TaxID=5321 RepID=A0ACB7IV20_PLECO|nr:hypothetical protein CCMSSC00406_0009945 [Pleurotus cornucopiae]
MLYSTLQLQAVPPPRSQPPDEYFYQMPILDALVSLFAFKTVPTTILVLLAYAAVFTSVLITDELPNVPKHQNGLNISKAFTDLRVITSHPHPYNSHANDFVRSYILSRVRAIAQDHPHVHIDDDNVSNGSWVSRGYAVYFEGTNILVKIDGSDPTSAGVLFSAHYDSVSTAAGATDDGMGVSTLIQLVDYFAQNPPERTVLFNINNGEEDWLNGAHAFLQHPWSKIPDTFLNLEGAASGGRPILFRATSTSPLLAFAAGHVRHPHGNVLSADAFARGVIRSGTDYSVYTEGAHMQGLDLAFYKGRSKYHTKFDSVPYTEGGAKSLWSMMEAAQGAGIALANDVKTHNKDLEKPVYFDLFGAAMIVFSLRSLTTINIVMLVIGPVMVILLSACEYIIQMNTRQGRHNGYIHGGDRSTWRHFWEWFIGFEWFSGFWRWAKLWVALGVTVGCQALLNFGYLKLNRYIVYSSPHIVLISSIALTYLSLSIILNTPVRWDGRVRPEQQKHTVLLQIYILTWLLLALSTVAIKTADIGGVYVITIWNSLAWLGCILSGLEEILGARGTTVWEIHAEEAERTRLVRGVRYDAIPQNEEREGHGEAQEVETEPTEITPLVAQQRARSRTPHGDDFKSEEHGAVGWWILQFLAVVPLPVILFSHIGIILLGALPQTLADGSSATVVYSALSFVALMVVLPMSPFMFKTQRYLAYAMLAAFIGTVVYSFLAFPFSLESPLKVFFQQQLLLDSLSEDSPTGRLTTTLTGIPEFLESKILPTLLSAEGKTIECNTAADRLGLTSCSWESTLIPSPAAGGDTKWLTVNVSRLDSTSARISIQGRNTRSCRVYFDEGSEIAEYQVQGGAQGVQEGFEGDRTLKEVRLWSRTWDRTFVVDIKRPEGVDGMKGRTACEWAEYESGMTGIEGVDGAKIPAFEEVLNFLPKWAVVTKMADGLVEVMSDFQL